MSGITLFPSAFPALAIAHFVALLSPGQDFFLILAHSARYRLRGSRYICLGIALGNAVYIAIAILGWNSIRDHSAVFTAIECLGAAYLIWIGWRLSRSHPYSFSSDTETVPRAPSFSRQLLLGLNSALLNPKNALFYTSLMVVILGKNVLLVQQLSCGLWMFLAVLCWDLLVAALISRPEVQVTLRKRLHYIERMAGFILMGIGISLFL